MRSILWSHEETQIALRMKAEGYTYREIGAHIGRAGEAVKKRLYSLGLPRLARPAPEPEPAERDGLCMPPAERNRRVLQFLAGRSRPVTREAVAEALPYLSPDDVRRAVNSIANHYLHRTLSGDLSITPAGREYLAEKGLPDTTLPDGRDAGRAAVVAMVLGRAEA